jgi:hypothetical protein
MSISGFTLFARVCDSRGEDLSEIFKEDPEMTPVSGDRFMIKAGFVL